MASARPSSTWPALCGPSAPSPARRHPCPPGPDRPRGGGRGERYDQPRRNRGHRRLPQTAELDRGHLVESVVDPGAVVPVDPAGGVSIDLGTSGPGVGPIRMLEDLDLVEPDTGFDECVAECVADAADRRGDPSIDKRLSEAGRRVLRRFKLAHRGEQVAACLLAAATNLSADTAVVVVGRVAIALLGASTTSDNTCFDRGAYDADIGLGLTGHDPAGRVAHAGTVEVEPNAPHQLGHVRLAEAGVSAARARGGTVETLVNATQEDIGIKADGPRMSLDDFSDCHVASVPVGILSSSGELAIPPLGQRHLWRSRRLHRQYG
jgi:hypothetical protein